MGKLHHIPFYNIPGKTESATLLDTPFGETGARGLPLEPTCVPQAALGSGGEGVFSGDPPAGSEATEGGVEHPLPRSEQGGMLERARVLRITKQPALRPSRRLLALPSPFPLLPI